jgi:hypothetical protein
VAEVPVAAKVPQSALSWMLARGAAGAGLTGKGEIELGAEIGISTKFRQPLELKQ